MGVMYLFDSLQRVRAAIVDGVTQCIHNEADYTLDAAIPSKYNAEPGEYLGLFCVDDVWRLFCITDAEDEDNEGLCYIKATDAAVDDLQHIVVQDKYQEDVTAKTAAEALLAGTEWTLANVTTDDTTNTTDAKWVSLWEALTTLATVFEANLRPYYIIEDGRITGKRIDLLKDEPVYRGMLYESRINADDVRLIKRKRPITVLYGLGKATGTGDDAENLTIADVVWSKANGDPADKPAGQLWVEDVEASAQYGRREQIFVAAEIEDANELQQATWDKLQKQKKPAITVELTIVDAEQLHGGKWKAVRLGDMATVRTKKKQDVETRVVNIHRDYVTPELTKFVSGEQMPSATNQVSGLIRASIKTQETLTVYRNRFLHDEALIQLYADTILVHAEELLSLRAGVDESLAEIILANGRIDANAAAIALKADQASLELANGRIEAQANEILLKADKVELDALVKATEFEALRADITNLTAGVSTASTLKANVLNADSTLIVGGEIVGKRSITMGDVVTVGKALSTDTMDLQHSHKVTVNDDGTITLGEVATEGGNFKIADTKAYKDGVSAAINSVTVYSPFVDRVEHPGASSKLMRVYMQAKASNGAVSDIASELISAAPVYDVGYNAGFAASESQYTAGTYYKGNGSVVYARGDTVTPTARTLYVAPTGGATAVTVYDVGSSNTLYKGNGGSWVSRGEAITAYIKA